MAMMGDDAIPGERGPTAALGLDATEIATVQQETCRRYGVAFVASPPQMKVGIARNVREGVPPLNGLRHPPQGDTTGWYIWAGEEWNDDPDFFAPLCVEHLAECCPAALGFLGLPPGWRFLVADSYEDVWEDARLLKV